MGMILDDNMSELMIDAQTGRLYKRTLTLEEKARVILSGDKAAEEKLEILQGMGFDLEGIFDIAMSFEN